MSRKPQNKRKRDTAYPSELHTRDVNSREIFKNDTLAQPVFEKLYEYSIVCECSV